MDIEAGYIVFGFLMIAVAVMVNGCSPTHHAESFMSQAAHSEPVQEENKESYARATFAAG